MIRPLLALSGAVLALGLATAAWADPDLVTPAKVLFARASLPSDQPTQSIGSYAKGCLAGAQALPLDGPHWQVMRLSRNRNWGTPRLIDYIEKFSSDAANLDGWPGLLIGDMAQPRGGPMLTGHASHQIGLDADIWFVPMPTRKLSPNERETIPAVSLLMTGRLSVDPAKWSDQYMALLKRAASYPEVARIFISPAIKKQLCDAAKGPNDWKWLTKLRPWWGHDDHFHVRLECPPGMATCVGQTPVGKDDGCGAELAWWLRPPPPVTKPTTPPKPVKPPPPLTLAGLPKACVDVLYAKDAQIKAVDTGDAVGKLIGRDQTGATITK